MKIRVRVHAGSRTTRTEVRGDELHIWVNVPPVDGKANARVIEILAELHGVARSRIRLASGHTSKSKIFEVDAPPLPHLVSSKGQRNEGDPA